MAGWQIDLIACSGWFGGGELDGREDMDLGCAAATTARVRSGGIITHDAPAGPETLAEEALPDGGEIQEGGNDELVNSSTRRRTSVRDYSIVPIARR